MYVLLTSESGCWWENFGEYDFTCLVMGLKKRYGGQSRVCPVGFGGSATWVGFFSSSVSVRLNAIW